MISFFLAIILILVALTAIALYRTYYAVPVRELKRRARANDPLAKVLYRAVAYGASLGLMLWTVVVLALVGSFVLLEHIVPTFLAFVVEAIAVGVGYAWIPASDLTKASVRLVVLLTPAVTSLLEALHPLLDRVVKFVSQRRQFSVHTGLYEQDDLLGLLEKQKELADSRIPHAKLDLLIHALTFGDKEVYGCMVPRREVRSISADEVISPVVIRELHDSGLSRFPVFDGKPDHIVGTLYLRDLVTLKKSGQVREVMEPNVYYVHEEYPLEQVLHAFLKTKHHLFIVVNKFEEYVGIITIEDIIEQILGVKIVDEFDAYDDIRAVAANHAKREHKEHQKDGEEVIKGTSPPKAEAESAEELSPEA